MLRVVLHTPETLAGDEEPPAALEVDYVSFVDSSTHGPPALVAPGRDRGDRVQPTVRPGESVLYINNGARDAFPAFEIERLEG